MSDKDKSIKNITETKKEVFVNLNNDHLKILSANQDALLKTAEKLLDLKLTSTSYGITILGQGSSVDLAADLFTQLTSVLDNDQHFSEGDLKRAIKILSSDRNAQLSNLMEDKIHINGRNKSVFPKTVNQKQYLEALRQYDLVFGIGPAGTGKTYLAMAMAVSALLNKEVKRIILTRPAVEAGEKLGFLPGDLTEKVNPYLRPLYDALYDLVGVEQGNELIEKGAIEVAPLAFMRGRTLSNAVVILDEAQNTSCGQMKMFLTRLGQGSKCLVTGDVTQIDLPRHEESGLKQALHVLKDCSGMKIIHFDETDVIRHKLVAEIIRAYNSYNV